jgi:aspartokinase-like uncharacterized kinase
LKLPTAYQKTEDRLLFAGANGESRRTSHPSIVFASKYHLQKVVSILIPPGGKAFADYWREIYISMMD